MELSWSTFLLEIINFLVLVWILKRFLYKPVLNVIERRRADIEGRLTEAADRQREAEALKSGYEHRLADWEQERQQARDALARELVQERERRVAELEDELAQERERREVAEARRQTDALHKMESLALRQGAEFAARLLRVAAGPEVEARLLDLLVSGLGTLSPERLAAIRNHHGSDTDTASVATAHPLSEAQREALRAALSRVAGRDLVPEFSIDTELLAGARVVLGTWVLAANIRDELEGLVSLAHDS